MMQMWTIYWNPRDHPGKFVVREFRISPHTPPQPCLGYILADTLEFARYHIPEGATCLGREPDDEAQIVETWI